MLASPIFRAFLPMDRLQVLAAGTTLSDRAHGAALFADISGFTPLTAALAAEVGRQRGAELVLDYINPIYEALIGALHDYRGSVIGFAGDSITCWLEGDDGRRAVTCALAMQAIMGRFATIHTPGGQTVTLAIKIGVAVGPARRFLAGDPALHNFEALAGATLERMAAAEGQAQKGEVVVSGEVAAALGADLEVADWRGGSESASNQPAGGDKLASGEGAFAVVRALANPAAPVPWPELPEAALPAETLRAWIDAPVVERLESSAGYLAELRPVTALFIRFSGIDYDGDDDAGRKLNAFVRRVQGILKRYDGYLLQLTIGDKGSNLLAVFGAPVAHDDDPQRCLAAALDLRQAVPEIPFITEIRLGISEGLAWAGAVGGRMRCIYTVMGDEVNMAARLMGKAAAGQTLVSGHVAQTAGQAFHFCDLGLVQVKGKDQPIAVTEALGRRAGVAARLGALFHTPLVGREAVLAEMQTHLLAAAQGQGIVLRLEGPAGVGKSHLSSVLVAQAASFGWQVAAGMCSSTDQGTPYVPWRQILLALLGIADLDPAQQIARLPEALPEDNPDWAQRLPLLGDLLGLPIPETPLTAGLEPRQRRDSLTALVVELLRVWAARQPLLLVLEDAHWIDENSAALAVAVARALAQVTCAMLVVQRPPLSADQPILPELDDLPHLHGVILGDLTRDGIAVLGANRLRGELSRLALDLVWAQAQGNPFFTEELLDALVETGYLASRPSGGWDLSAAAFDALLGAACLVKVDGDWQMVENPPLSAAALDIPDSVQGTVLARLDRLPEAHKLALKVASVIGRTFNLELLRGVHPLQPEAEALRTQIEQAGRRDFVRLERPGTDPVYIFKHNTTQEVTYCTLLFAQRQELHGRVGAWYEGRYGGSAAPETLTLDSPLAPYYPLLVHHWHNAERPERERHYAGLAGEQAAKKFANESAVRYFGRAFDLAPEDEIDTRYRLLTGREAVLDVMSDRQSQERDLAALETIAQARGAPAWNAAVALRRARFADLTGEHEQALAALQSAIADAAALQDLSLESRAYHQWGRLLWKQGQPVEGREKLERGLELALRVGDRLQEGRCYIDIADTFIEQADFPSAMAYYQRSLDAYQEVGYRLGEISCLVDISATLDENGRHVEARQNRERALRLCRTIGWRRMEAHCLGQMGNNSFDLGDYAAAKVFLKQALVINREIGNRYGEALNQDTLGLVDTFHHDFVSALESGKDALRLQEQIKDRRGQGYTLNHLALAHTGLGQVEDARARFSQALALREDIGQALLIFDDLAGMARLELMVGCTENALQSVGRILAGINEYSLDGAEFPAWIHLTCSQVFAAAGQLERSAEARRAGQALVLERAEQIQDPDLRQQFLEQVPFNRALVAAPVGD